MRRGAAPRAQVQGRPQELRGAGGPDPAAARPRGGAKRAPRPIDAGPVEDQQQADVLVAVQGREHQRRVARDVLSVNVWPSAGTQCPLYFLVAASAAGVVQVPEGLRQGAREDEAQTKVADRATDEYLERPGMSVDPVPETEETQQTMGVEDRGIAKVHLRPHQQRQHDHLRHVPQQKPVGNEPGGATLLRVVDEQEGVRQDAYGADQQPQDGTPAWAAPDTLHPRQERDADEGDEEAQHKRHPDERVFSHKNDKRGVHGDPDTDLGHA
mmetsp:Transcript_85756/g.227905  ORF Transcript_85756/g.227905 Transcript_85756/m.227905 type:complete len:269 (-) Transcript_85756:785-1591(-)